MTVAQRMAPAPETLCPALVPRPSGAGTRACRRALGPAGFACDEHDRVPVSGPFHGLTYRQLDYWTRVGYLRPVDPTPGSGGAREWPELEVEVAGVIVRLLRAGLRLDVAARAAREQAYDRDGHVLLRGGVHLNLTPVDPAPPTPGSRPY